MQSPNSAAATDAGKHVCDEQAMAELPARADPICHSGWIANLLLDWQSMGRPDQLEAIVTAIRPLVKRMAAATLQRRGIPDPFAIEEAISLVLDHLRRLHCSPSCEPPVARFVSSHANCCRTSQADPGRAYVLWLARERAADVARARHRQSRHFVVFSQLDKTTTGRLEACIASGDSDGDATASTGDLRTQLHEAIGMLPPRERMVIELLLEGKSQAVISHMIGVCEGTVSRLRSRATAKLREVMAE